MDFVDKVAEGARDVAKNLMNTTTDLVEKGKKQLELTRLKSDRRDALVRLGEVAYLKEKGYGSDEGYSEILSTLDTLTDRINELEAAREEERAKREEERAKREEARAATAAAAGTPFEVQFTHETCKQCGKTRVGTLQFCGYCGAKFEE